MQQITHRVTRLFILLPLLVVGFFAFTAHASAGVLTNFSYSGTTYIPGETADYTFSYTIETADPNMIFYAGFPAGFDLSSSGATVTIDGTPATVGEYWNGGPSPSNPYIRLTDPTAPSGSHIVVVISDVVNPIIPASYTFDWVHTANGGGNAIDNPTSINPISIGIPFSGLGTGAELTPYQITTCGQLAEVNNHLYSAYLLTTSIDCTLAHNDIIIGDRDYPFTGIFDGGEHTITVDIDSTADDRTGLFRYINEGTLKNLTVAGSVTSTAQNTGMIAGQIMNTESLDNLHSSGTVESTGGSVGGLFGSTFCVESITNSTSSATVSGVNDVGGFIGSVGCMGIGPYIANSSATGNVTGTDYVGGFIGSDSAIDTDNIFATGSVSGQDNVGGLIGYHSSFDERKIFHAYAIGNVTGRHYLGGLIGFIDSGIISQSYSTGDVTSAGGDNIGGFAGHISTEVTIRNSFARGNATITGGEGSVAGFIGETNDLALIINSYSTGAPISTSDLAKGGFVGDGSGTNMHGTFWDTQSSANNVACWNNTDCGVFGKTTAQMKTQSTFATWSWNFNTIWGMNVGTNDGYPYLLGGDDIVPDIILKAAVTDHRTSIGGYASSASLAKAGITLEAGTGLKERTICPADQTLSYPVNISLLQKRLLALGFNPGPIDGISGPMTKNTIKQAQTKLGTLADGLVGPITRGLINNSCTTI